MANALKTDNYIVAFIYVLGAKQMIKKDVNGSLSVIHEVYESSLEFYKKVFSPRIKFDITIFSDNIVVAKKIYDKKDFAKIFIAIQIMTAVIQGNFLFRGILTRGGIAYGKFFKDDIMIWGDALVKAYSLEESVAIYPRIVIDPELVGQLHIFPDGPEKSPYWLKQDFDGILYLDYLQERLIKDFGIMIAQEFARYDDRIVEAGSNTRLMQKYIWHANYLKSKLTVGDSIENDEAVRH